MALTVRLDPKAERALNALAKRRQVSRSDIVREALALYEGEAGGSGAGSKPYDDWLDVLGIVNLGTRNPGQTTGEQLTALLQEKVHKRRAR